MIEDEQCVEIAVRRLDYMSLKLFELSIEQ